MKVTNLLRNITEKRTLVIFFIFALLLRIGVILVLGQSQKWHENVLIAINLVSGRGFSYRYFSPSPLQPTCIMAPFYPFFLAAFFMQFGINNTALMAVQLIQVVIGALTIFPIYYLSRNFFSQRTAVVSCLVFSVYPDFLYSVFIIHPITFTTFLVPTLVYFTNSLQKAPTLKKAVTCGVLYGFSLLVEPVIISIFCLMVLWIVFSWIRRVAIKDSTSSFLPKFSWKRKGMTIILMVVSCGLVISPWEVRCLAVYDGNFVFIKAGGFNLWRGNNAQYTETGVPPWSTGDMIKSSGLSKEGDIDRMFYELAIAYISSHMLGTLWNSLRKIIDLWWFPKVLTEQSPPLRRLIYAPLLALAIGALFYERKKIQEFMPLIIPLLGFTLLYSITFVLPRYRVPVQPLLFIFSAYGLVIILDIIKIRFYPRPKAYTNVSNSVSEFCQYGRNSAITFSFENPFLGEISRSRAYKQKNLLKTMMARAMMILRVKG